MKIYPIQAMQLLVWGMLLQNLENDLVDNEEWRIQVMHCGHKSNSSYAAFAQECSELQHKETTKRR